MLGISAESDVGLGAADAWNLGKLISDDFGEILVLVDPCNGNQVPVACDGVDFTDARDCRDLLCALGDTVSCSLDHDECGDHHYAFRF